LHRPDVAVVHFGNELPAFAASLLGPLVGAGGMKWVWQQDQQIADPSPLAARLNRLRLLALRFDHFVAVYQGGKASLLARGVPAARISVIHNSVSDHGPDRGRGWLRKELDLESDAVLLVGVGSLIPRKRHNLLLQVLRAAGRRTHLVIAGDGPLRQELESRVAEMGLDRRVHLLGLRNDVRDILTEADLYVSAAVAEGCNYTLLEAMATGVPAVVTESGAAREQIEDGVSGYVVGLNDVAGFACRVEALLSDADRRRAMGDAARELWARMFRIEDAASKYRELYRRLAVGDFGS
jgi:glycosyltransferase involved in cell wall biosynthesis